MKVGRFEIGTAAVAVAVAVAVGVAFGSYRTYDYIQNDPEFCTSCHLMQDMFDRWAESGHRDVNCHTCHPGDVVSNLHQLWVTVTEQPTAVKKHAVVPVEICGQCHLSEDPKWRQIAATAGHALHYAELDIECVTCHAPRVHEFVPTDEMCERCHADVSVGLSAMARNHCTSCHDFLADAGDSLIPTGEDCGRCHQAQGGDRVEGGGTSLRLATDWHAHLDCVGCHPVHDVARTDAVPRADTAVACEDCHDDTHTLMATDVAGHGSCEGCHPPHSDIRPEDTCATCHSGPAESLGDAAPHLCGDCHTPHADWIEPEARCEECHAEDDDAGRTSFRERTPVPAHRACTACHAPHEPAAPDRDVCVACHPVEARVEAPPGSAMHPRCDACHLVHDVDRGQADCGRCHEPVEARIEDVPREHAVCLECHRAHAVRGEANIQDCQRCHSDTVRRSAGEPAEHRACGACHPSHGIGVLANSCERCHVSELAALSSEPAAHRDGCGGCHPSHGRGDSGDRACAGCHDAVRIPTAAPAEHRACSGCHPGHEVGRAAQRCDTCHADEVRAVSATRAEHRDCASCHGDPHALPVSGRSACGDCHTVALRSGLHAHDEHQVCMDCHRPHPAATRGAEACVACHPPEEIKTHPPEARGVEQCQGCHSFRAWGPGKGGSP